MGNPDRRAIVLNMLILFGRRRPYRASFSRMDSIRLLRLSRNDGYLVAARIAVSSPKSPHRIRANAMDLAAAFATAGSLSRQASATRGKQLVSRRYPTAFTAT